MLSQLPEVGKQYSRKSMAKYRQALARINKQKFKVLGPKQLHG